MVHWKNLMGFFFEKLRKHENQLIRKVYLDQNIFIISTFSRKSSKNNINKQTIPLLLKTLNNKSYPSRKMMTWLIATIDYPLLPPPFSLFTNKTASKEITDNIEWNELGWKVYGNDELKMDEKSFFQFYCYRRQFSIKTRCVARQAVNYECVCALR